MGTLEKYNGNLPKDFKPKLSKIGERKAAEGIAERDEIIARWEILSYSLNRARKEISELPDPLADLKQPDMSHEELREKFNKLDEADRKARGEALIERRGFLRFVKTLYDDLDELDELVIKHNKKWGTKIPLPSTPMSEFHRKPSERTQFKKGKSGNPKGRPKIPKDRKSMVQRLANEEIVVTEAGCPINKRIAEVVLETLVRLSLTGNSRAAKLHAAYVKKYDPPDDEVGYLIVPEQLTVDETIESLEEHRLTCIKAMEQLEEEERNIPRVGGLGN